MSFNSTDLWDIEAVLKDILVVLEEIRDRLPEKKENADDQQG
jgi:hypothetical protein